ncbi:MAG: inorganic phosphate transporter [Oscillospiraceae bacterium]|nr:inorganic phosphate transporter [Oscillospiraceae bacterium]
MGFIEFFQQMFQSPTLLFSTLLTLGVVLVNGWTDAPNAIATCVSTRAIEVRKAIIMAAIFNFLGVLVMTIINQSVADTIYKMVDFGSDPKEGLIGLCAAMAAIVIWATAAWYFGIPTSESHALIAGLTGAAIAMHGSLDGVNGGQWIKVIYGIVLSTLLGFGLGFISAKITTAVCRNKNRLKTEKFFSGGQVAGGAAMAFMHGAQDGQKFMAIFLLASALSQGKVTSGQTVTAPIWLMLLISLVMGLGTSIGGYRIIKSVGMDMVKLKPYQGFAADFSSTLCLLAASLFGIPVSTTHAKTTAIMGVGAAKRMSNVKWSVVKELILTWVCTFPGCGLLGFLMAKLFLFIF